MASRLMSAYGNLASARTNIGKSLSNITGIGIEMEYGPEGRISGEMAQSRIQKQTEAMTLAVESLQHFTGLGVQAKKEAGRALEVGGKEVYKTKTPEGKPGYTTEGSLWQKMGRYLGFSEREYDIGGSRYTSSQIETALPYHRAGKSWEDISKFIKFVGDNKNFKDAFKFARDNYGPDAIFIWRGKKYNTKHKGEK